MNPLEKIKSALRRLDMSVPEQKIYLSLLTEGRATARVLAARTSITRPSVYDQLKSLRTLGLVIELEIEGKTHFAAADIKNLDALLADKIDHLSQGRDFLADALPSLLESLETVAPKLRFFEGEEGLKQLLKDIMWHDKTILQIFWNHESICEVYDSKFLTWFDDRRSQRQLAVHSLWPFDTNKNTSPLFSSLKSDQRKRLPKINPTKMSYIIYDKKVAFISSTAEAFGFIVESKEFSEVQKLQFEMMWQSGKKF